MNLCYKNQNKQWLLYGLHDAWCMTHCMIYATMGMRIFYAISFIQSTLICSRKKKCPKLFLGIQFHLHRMPVLPKDN